MLLTVGRKQATPEGIRTAQHDVVATPQDPVATRLTVIRKV